MRKRRSLSIVRAGNWPAWYDEPRPSRSRYTPGAAMSRLGVSSCSRLSLTLFFLVVLNSMLFMAVGAAPVTSVSNDRRSSAGSRTSLSRCPAIFNPIPMVANAKVATSSDQTAQNGQSNATEPSTCRYFLTKRFGTLTTPGFPSAFPLPFMCSWIINATGFEADSFVTLYLTQMYLTRGVKAVQYSFRNETTAIGRKELDELHTLRPRPYSVYRIKARYLEVQVNLDELVNANLRVERRFMDVYGFNITYEIQPNTSRIRSDTCNVANCTFNGHCYANHNYSQFQCSCLPDFSGKYCQYGPECNPAKGINVCKNGGVCGYRSGLTVVRCSCPPNYNGSLCEFRREFIPSKECLSRFRLNCSHHCAVTDKGGAACRCPFDQALRSDNVTCYPLVPLRIVGQVELDRPITFNDTRLVDGVTTELRKMADELTAFKLVIGSVHLLEPNSNRLQFIMWNSERYNMSWTNAAHQQGPMTAAVKGRTASLLKIGSSWTGVKKRMPRDIINPFPITYIPQQWNNSYSSFVNQINTKTWKVQGEAIAIRNLSIVQVPALIIEWVKLDVKGQVREGYPFTVACNANGSGRKDLKMGWFKDGHRVDDSFALARNVSIFIHEKQDLRGFFTFYLEVKQASLADRGEFECRATDWGQTVRKSVFLDVITPPILDLMPINPVVLPGTAVNLTCRDENHLARRTTTKYVWLKNGRPIESSCDEIIEDLTPVGSLLKITAIQHSTNYSCRGENGTKLANKTTHIFVVRPDRACPQEKNRGVDWLMTAVDVTNYQFCPAGYVGVTRRRCLSVKQPIDNSEITATLVREFWKWGEPDFSDCSDREVTELYRQLKLITLGYAVTDIASIINKFADFIQRKLKDFADLKSAGSEQTIQFPYLPGEGNALLEIAMNLEAFLWRRTEVLPQSFWNSTAIQYLYALDALLSMPKDFFRLDAGIPILRFIQNHLTLLGISPKGGYPLGAIESHLLKNSDIDTDLNKKELKYKERLKFLPSQTGFKNLTQLAPAQFFLNKPNGSNVTMDFFSTIEQLQIRGGEYICALLLLQPTNHSRGWDYWDMNSCSVERLSDPSAFRCLCSHQGTVVLLYAERDSMHTDATFDLWKIIVFVASTSSLIVVIGVIVLSIKWYRHRCVWAWFQIQLGVALVPPSSVYFLPTESIISDPFWTIVLTVATYQFVTTVWAMIMYLKMNAIHCPDEEEVSDKFNQNNVRLVGLSIGIPLSLSGVQSLIEEFSTGSPFVSWFSQLSSISGIFFCLIYCTLLIAILSLYVMSTRVRDVSSEKFNAFTQEVPYVTEISSGYNQRCLLLAILSLLLTGTMLSHLRWMSLSAHCIAAFLHLLEVLLVFALMMTFSGTNYTCSLLCFWRRNKLPEGETVNELLNATAMVESPQRRNLLSQEQLPVDEDETLKTINKTKRTSQPSVDDTVFPAPKRSKRCNRTGPASSPLLQRAGLGPEVLRAFGVEPQSSHQLVGKTTGCLQAENTSVNGPGDAIRSGRDRVNSIATCDGLQRDDMDSGFGPSGGGGSQKLNGLDRFSDAWKFLSRIRWNLPIRGFPSNGSTSGGGSFRSRQSTMSSATTAEFGGEQSSSVTTEETEVQIRESEDAESLMAPYRLRRSRTRWTDDYGRENELDSREVSNLTIKCKPYRGRCFIRCSPEKIGSNALWNHQCQDVISDRQASWFPTQNDSCERCWHNPETPFCDICLTDVNSHPVQSRPGTMFVRAVIENPPKLPNKDDCEYLKMDAAGSLAVDQQRVKRLQVYYNTTVKPATQTTNDGDSNAINKEKLMSCASFTKSSCISPSLLRQKKILNGRIFKKYRISLRNVVHSTQQRRPYEINYPAEFISLRDQTL